MAQAGPTLLVVDDEEEVRSRARAALEGRGYAVLTARNSVEALLLFHHHGGPIRLLITDLSMPPYMDGASLAKAMRGARPDLGVLFLSSHGSDPGLSADWDIAGGPVAGCFLAKPFTSESLVKRVEAMLADSGGTAPSDGADPKPAKEEAPRCILIMVPQSDVRSSVATLLRSEGYQVLEVRDVGEALVVSQWHVGSIGLLLADRDALARMPGELKERLGEVRPGMRILAASVPGVADGSLGERVRHALEEWGLEARGEP